MRARYYDPVVRRFISEDPIGLAGGINWYAFAAGDPINRSDPSGLGPNDVQDLPGITVWGMLPDGCWSTGNTYDDDFRMRSWGQDHCGAGAQPSIMDAWEPPPTVGRRPPTSGEQLPGKESKIFTEGCGRAAINLVLNAGLDYLTWGQGGMLRAAAQADVAKMVYIVGENAMTAFRGLPVKNISGTTISNTARKISQPMAAWMFTGGQIGMGSVLSGSLPTLRDLAIGTFVPFGGTGLAVAGMWKSCR
jgi:hypothetical protein